MTRLSPSGSRVQDTMIVWTKLSADADAIARMLNRAGIAVDVCMNVDNCAAALPSCLGAILTLEVLSPAHLAALEAALTHQPAWSDVPILILTGRKIPPTLPERMASLRNVAFLERPLRPSSLLSVVHSAVRARRRQFEVADLLRQNASLNEKLRRSMTETHHRVKNNLQLIAALVEVTAMEADETVPRDELTRLGTHIGVLAGIHDILTEDTKNRGDGTSLSVKAVLENLISLLVQALSGRRISSSIEDVRLSTRHCTSLGVIANELVSNALKYTQSDVEVQFTTSGGFALLTVCDDGPGFPNGFDPRIGGHTGLDLVLNLSEHDLGGTVRFENEPARGACVTVRFPLPGA